MPKQSSIQYSLFDYITPLWSISIYCFSYLRVPRFIPALTEVVLTICLLPYLIPLINNLLVADLLDYLCQCRALRLEMRTLGLGTLWAERKLKCGPCGDSEKTLCSCMMGNEMWLSESLELSLVVCWWNQRVSDNWVLLNSEEWCWLCAVGVLTLKETNLDRGKILQRKLTYILL